jgi:hypothetical protein
VYVYEEEQAEGSELTVEVDDVLLGDDKGGTSPFALITRAHEEGQIIDINTSFGSVYIKEKS